jgi:hypothetical protein
MVPRIPDTPIMSASMRGCSFDTGSRTTRLSLYRSGVYDSLSALFPGW